MRRLRPRRGGSQPWPPPRSIQTPARPASGASALVLIVAKVDELVSAALADGRCSLLTQRAAAEKAADLALILVEGSLRWRFLGRECLRPLHGESSCL